MSEIIDPVNDDALYEKLAPSECGKKVYIPSEDPLGLYNHAVRQFNAKCNKTSEESYQSLDTSCFYGFWMYRWWTLMRADTNVFFLIITFIVTFLISLAPIVNIVEFIIWLIVYLVYERSQRTHSRFNKKLSNDPFKYMVKNNELCLRAGLMNLYYDLPVGQISTLGLRESQVELLKSKRNGSNVTFMIYNDRFRYAYTKFGFLRIVHITHILISLAGILVANLLIYPKTGIGEFFQSTN